MQFCIPMPGNLASSGLMTRPFKGQKDGLKIGLKGLMVRESLSLEWNWRTVVELRSLGYSTVYQAEIYATKFCAEKNLRRGHKDKGEYHLLKLLSCANSANRLYNNFISRLENWRKSLWCLTPIPFVRLNCITKSTISSNGFGRSTK